MWMKINPHLSTYNPHNIMWIAAILCGFMLIATWVVAIVPIVNINWRCLNKNNQHQVFIFLNYNLLLFKMIIKIILFVIRRTCYKACRQQN
jgi:hypothetical protein